MPGRVSTGWACISWRASAVLRLGAFRVSACHRRPAHCWDACDGYAPRVSVSRLFEAGGTGGVAGGIERIKLALDDFALGILHR